KLRGEEAEVARVGSATPPPRKEKAAKEAEDAAKAALAPVLLAESWDGVLDPKGWWMSEKLDGIRAYWTGSQMLSRKGNIIHTPEWFTKNLPDHPLDGELFMDRKSFQKTSGIVRRQDKSDLWKQIRYLIFDAPAHGGKFEERLALIEKLPKHDWA